MEQVIEICKVLSDETRYRILHLLSKQELCVCELVEILELSQPKISKHIAKIRSANLVKTVRNEQYITYSLNTDNKQAVDLLYSMFNIYQDLSVIKNDITKLKRIDTFICKRELS